jgi:hypothetical protein
MSININTQHSTISNNENKNEEQENPEEGSRTQTSQFIGEGTLVAETKNSTIQDLFPKHVIPSIPRLLTVK